MMRRNSLIRSALGIAVFALAASIFSLAQYGNADQGSYQILSARYGTERHNVDVTERLKELASQDMRFRMGNSTFGVDPDHGVLKTLRIFARGQNGRVRVFEYRESSTVDGSIFSGWGRGNWGNAGGWNGGWNSGDEGEYRIIRALYGTERNNVDVTDRLRELARQDMRFRMGNSTFGVDPDPGVRKMLRIFARGANGDTRTFEYREGSTIDGTMFSGWGRGDWGNERWNGGWRGPGRRDRDNDGDDDDDRSQRGNNGQGQGWGWGRGGRDRDRNQGSLTIIRATYGVGPRAMDVTGRLQSLVRNGRLDIVVNSDTLGGDPAPGHRKSLFVTFNGPSGQRQMTVGEHGRLTIP